MGDPIRIEDIEQITGLLGNFETGTDMTNMVFCQRVVAGRYKWVLRDRWSTDEKRYEGRGDRVMTMVWPQSESSLLYVPDIGHPFVRTEIGSGNADVAVAANTEEEARVAMTRLREEIPESVAAEGAVPIAFWSYGSMGPRSNVRKIEVPAWETVEHNYVGDVRAELGRLVSPDFRPSFGGQLMLWLGVPGTGKTWALRSLIWEWREWASFDYIVDPEKFFGDRADYMLDVLLQDPQLYAVDDNFEEEQAEKWNVLILEDSGELLAADAKERTGQGLARLLNVVDGLIGQGLKVLVLITTNEEIKRLHPAVSRPGRCAAKVEFRAFDTYEAAEWYREHDFDPASGGGTLAELYGRLEGYYGDSVSLLGFTNG